MIKKNIIEENGKVYQTYDQDVSATIKANQDFKLNTYMPEYKKRDMWLVASIPTVVVVDLKAKHGYDLYNEQINDDASGVKLMQLLKDNYPWCLRMEGNL
jgi:hypothetical protein